MELIKYLKANKVEHYKTDDLDIKFSPLAHLPESKEVPMSKVEDENELLYYSAGERPA